MTKVETVASDLEATTLHQKIVGDIQGKIVSGEWPVGQRIPFEVDLAVAYGVSRMTANKALSQLARAGLIERVKKGGSFVSRPHTQSAVLEIGHVRNEVESLGLPYVFRITRFKRRKATRADLALLDLRVGDPLVDLVCVHFAGTRPFCLEQRLINLVTVPDAANVEFKDMPPSQWLLSRVPWTSAEHRIHAAAASNEDATVLEIANGSPCLVVERRTWHGAGSVTHVKLSYPGDRHALVATFTPAS